MRRIVKSGGEEVKLSPKEYEACLLLIQHAGKVLTHKFLSRNFGLQVSTRNISASMLGSQVEDPARPGAAAIYFDEKSGIGYG